MKKLLLATAALMLLWTSMDAKPNHRKMSHKSAHKAKHKPTYYVYGDGTYGTKPTDATRPSPYKGDRVPENDGLKKNKERNLNYTSGQPATSR